MNSLTMIIYYLKKDEVIMDKCEMARLPEYDELEKVLDAAYHQAAHGKGRERHANNKPWIEQPIFTITNAVGVGFPAGQAIKKLEESIGMYERGELGAAMAELLGAIVYTAAAFVKLEQEDAGREVDKEDILKAEIKVGYMNTEAVSLDGLLVLSPKSTIPSPPPLPESIDKDEI